jgi:sugar/nucleoside kinase (ribokinase family)
VRQLWDQKASARLEDIPAHELAIYGGVCGWTLARAHARTGPRAAIAAYLGGGDRFDRALADFAEAYADQNERDHAALAEAVKRGRIPAETGI